MPDARPPADLEWLAPWVPIKDSGEKFVRELEKEVGDGHPLKGVRVVAVARSDGDDVLFATDDPAMPLAVVHLTWASRPEPDPRWPHTTVPRLAGLDRELHEGGPSGRIRSSYLKTYHRRNQPVPVNLKPFSLESLSDVRYSFWTGKHPRKPYDRDVLVIRFEGSYGYGCKGNSDATFMRCMGNAAVEALEPDAIITDLSALSYEWGDQMDCVFGIGCDRKVPTALVVGDKCRKAIGTLCFGETSKKDACEQEWIFDSLDGAWAYVTKLLDEDGKPPLHEAASAGDLERVKQLLAAGENPNRTDSEGETPLHRASDPAIVKLLLDAGADVNAKDRISCTPLHLAKNLDCVRLLLESGADPDARSWSDHSPLSHTQTVEIAELLIEAGADIHLRQRSSLLHFCRKAGLAKLFIEKGVGVNLLDQNGRTPLDLAEESQRQFQWQADNIGLTNDAATAKQYADLAALLREYGGKHGVEVRAAKKGTHA